MPALSCLPRPKLPSSQFMEKFVLFKYNCNCVQEIRGWDGIEYC